MVLVKKLRKRLSKIFVKKQVSVQTQTIIHYPIRYSNNYWLSDYDEVSRFSDKISYIYSEKEQFSDSLYSKSKSSYEFSIVTKFKKNFLLDNINV